MKLTRPKPVPPLVDPALAEHALTPVSMNGAPYTSVFAGRGSSERTPTVKNVERSPSIVRMSVPA